MQLKYQQKIDNYILLCNNYIEHGSWIFQLPLQSLSITTEDVSSNPAQVYSIQHYVIKFVSDLRQVGGFLRVLRFPLSIKLTAKNWQLYFAL
jgi:hypothetical protein